MAVTTLTFSLNDPRDVHADGKRMFVSGSLAIGASPLTYVTNGIPIPTGLGLEPVKSQTQPRWLIAWSVTTAGTNIYVYDYAHNTLRIFVSGSELTNGSAIGAGVSGDTILFVAEFFQNR